jgi:hypothetical protein
VTREAIIQGEVHGLGNDVEELLGRRTDETDMLFVEGRSDSELCEAKNLSVGYIFLLIGYLMATRFQPAGSLEEKVKKTDLKYDDEIDAELPQIWEIADKKVVVSTFLVLLILFYLFAQHSILLGILWIILSPSVFSAPILVVANGEREEEMAESIHRESQKQGFEEVLVLCGDSHVLGIKENLESKGWKIDEKRSTCWIARGRRWVAKRLY